jgi:hypothetical protein
VLSSEVTGDASNFLTATPSMDAASIGDIINYEFGSEALLYGATLAAGASVSDVNIDGVVHGNKALALIGDALIRLVIVDRLRRRSRYR